jgi:hypothetical protein
MSRSGLLRKEEQGVGSDEMGGGGFFEEFNWVPTKVGCPQHRCI